MVDIKSELAPGMSCKRVATSAADPLNCSIAYRYASKKLSFATRPWERRKALSVDQLQLLGRCRQTLPHRRSQIFTPSHDNG